MFEKPDRPECRLVDHKERTTRTAVLVEQLHAVVEELEAMHPGRKFPLDGHLVGSIGEAAAEAMFDVELVPASSAGHDAIAGDGRQVEIKATYGSSGVAIRQTSHTAAAALIVLKLSRTSGVEHEVVFNGPLATAFQAAGTFGTNGQARMGLSRLRVLDQTIRLKDRVPRRRP
ncbi:hypothetical protein ASG88_09100 [Nocardioides sp. Soil777]|uniref:DUF6998 domain-containing protein n=1 Tax=Nocardioides sp. Soil777 TaxID=1736409 RepID=UPI00070362B3|nr:hypothetical protein [Nocardioides sp. Soil777]KRF00615.1 hypothetical protein ASG88_09100 [Nocardioides sp. Soil777]